MLMVSEGLRIEAGPGYAGLSQKAIVDWGIPVPLTLCAAITQPGTAAESDLALPLLHKACTLLFGKVSCAAGWALDLHERIPEYALLQNADPCQ